MQTVQVKKIQSLKINDRIVGMAGKPGNRAFKATKVLHVFGVNEIKDLGMVEVVFYTEGRKFAERVRRLVDTPVLVR